MKQQSLSISIPEPCHENWSEMTPTEKGRHCQSCQKTVVDFTRMPKVKIAEFISQQNGKTCGRFSSDQLNVELLPPKPSKTWMKYAAIILGLIPTLGCGQEVIVPKPQGQEMQPPLLTGDIAIETKGEVNSQTHLTNPKNIISGKVIDKETKKAMSFTKIEILLDGNILNTSSTDVDGHFKAYFPKNGSIKISSLGYQPQLIEYTRLNSRNTLQIEMLEIPEMPMGIIEQHRIPEENLQPEDKNEENHKVSTIINREIEGKLVSKKTGEELIFATITVYKDDVLQFGGETDIEGNFKIEIPHGAYIECTYYGYKTKTIDYANIPSNGKFIISLDEQLLEEPVAVVGYFISAKTLNKPSNRDKVVQSEESEIKAKSTHFENTANPNASIKPQNSDSKIPLHYQSDTVEIVANKNDLNHMYITGLTVSSTGEKSDNWFKRQCRKIVSLVSNSHEVAQKNRKIEHIDMSNSLTTSNDDFDTNISSKTAIDKVEDDNKARENNSVKVYPNPSTGLFAIDIPSEFAKYYIEITDINNQLISRIYHTQFEGTIDLNNQIAGSYVISIISEGHLIASQMIIKM